MSVQRRWLSVPEAARYLNVGPRTLIRLMDRGEVARHRLGPQMVRVDVRELDAYLEGRAETPGHGLSRAGH